MFHKIKNVFALPEYKLSVQFSEGVTKIYDVKPLFEKIPAFSSLKNNNTEFASVYVDVGGYGIIWNDEIDLSFHCSTSFLLEAYGSIAQKLVALFYRYL